MTNPQPKVFVQTREMQKEFFHDGELMLRASIEYPVFSSQFFMPAIRNINLYYYLKAKETMRYGATSMRHAAIQDYEYRKENGYPFNPYELDMNTVVTYNYNCALSTYTDRYEYTGGAHGSVLRTSATWSLRQGKMLSLKDFFPNNPNYAAQLKREIKRQIAAQIATGENFYFENYEELVEQTFDEEQFFLTKDGLVIYFQQYDIAPYSSGLPEFEISHGTIPIRLPSCR